MWSALYSAVIFNPFISAVAVTSFLAGDLPGEPDHPDPPDAVVQRAAPPDRPGVERFTFATTDLDDLQIDLHAGDLTIDGTDADEVRIVVRPTRAGEHCRIEVGTEGRTLKVEALLDRGFGRGRCEVDVDVELPSSLTVDADVGAGDIRLDGAASPMTLDTGAGDVRGSAPGPGLRVDTGVGDIQLDALLTAVTASTGAGSVTLSFDSAPAGRIRASTGVGDVRVTLPEATPVHAETSTGLGSVRQELPQHGDAATEVHASTGLGDVVLKSR
jgi:DUF4097 and DUF4098 domain-containing protein YvlB